jgi:hypothetical protein
MDLFAVYGANLWCQGQRIHRELDINLITIFIYSIRCHCFSSKNLILRPNGFVSSHINVSSEGGRILQVHDLSIFLQETARLLSVIILQLSTKIFVSGEKTWQAGKRTGRWYEYPRQTNGTRGTRMKSDLRQVISVHSDGVFKKDTPVI